MDNNLKEITKGFAFQFENEIEQETTYGKNAQEILNTFLQDLQVSPKEVENSNTLVAGCGNGILLRELSKLNPKQIIGIDIHTKKASSNTENCENVILKEVDILTYISKEKFDFVYCRGVLHHTTDAKSRFYQLVLNLKKTGKIFIWLYEKQRLGFLRKLKPYQWKKETLLLFSKILAWGVFLPYNFFALLFNKNKKTYNTVKMNIFDALTCEIQTTHSTDEIYDWFKEKKLNFNKEKEGYLGYFD